MGFKGAGLAARTYPRVIRFFNVNVLFCSPSNSLNAFISLTNKSTSLSPKIEDGGKAALCEKLKVGDELININGSALYGSRQEALILIKGSYRILKLTVRR